MKGVRCTPQTISNSINKLIKVTKLCFKAKTARGTVIAYQGSIVIQTWSLLATQRVDLVLDLLQLPHAKYPFPILTISVLASRVSKDSCTSRGWLSGLCVVPVTAMESLLDEIARLLVEKEGTSLKANKTAVREMIGSG
jgi:hypothetical protein